MMESIVWENRFVLNFWNFLKVSKIYNKLWSYFIANLSSYIWVSRCRLRIDKSNWPFGTLKLFMNVHYCAKNLVVIKTDTFWFFYTPTLCDIKWNCSWMSPQPCAIASRFNWMSLLKNCLVHKYFKHGIECH